MMSRLLIAAGLFFTAIAAPVSAQTRMTQDEAAAVQHALDRGTLLYYYDQAAWHGTDDMLTKIGARKGEIGGWIVDGPATAPELVFYDKNSADPHAIYVARFEGGKLVSGRVLAPGDDSTLTPERKRMVAAVTVARAAFSQSDVERCVEQSFNTVVLPPETKGGPSLVYFLTPQTSNTKIPLGGHYSIAVSPDGTAGPVRRFAKSCISVSLDAEKADAVSAGMLITHLLNPTPTEIHVFSTLAAKTMMFVVTGKQRLWIVDAVDGRPQITLSDTSPLKPVN